MSDELLEKYIIQQIEATTDDVVMFSWHGGEPLLAGLEFYKKAVALQKKYLPPGKTVLNGIQTNGTLIDDEWCRFLSMENFIAGISIDGPGEFHDLNRRIHNDSGTLQRVLEGYGLLKKHGIRNEILCVVSAHNAGSPLIIYDFFKELDAKYITFLPLVIRQDKNGSSVTSNSVSPEGFGKFLIKIFDEWVEKDIGRIKIQLFEEALRSAFNQERTLCIFKVNCGGVPVLEWNGDFFACDHFVGKDHLYGNINERSLTSLLDSPEQRDFGRAKSQKLPHYCLECNVRDMCNGECPKNRFITTPDGEPGLNYLCTGYKLFFNHCLPFIDAIRSVREV